MVSLVALVIWRLPILLVMAGFLFFGTLDGLYLTSALTKVPNGAWFTLGLALILSSIFILWRYGKENQWRAEAEDRVPPSHLLTERPVEQEKEASTPILRLTPALGGGPVSRVRGLGIFFDKTGSPNGTPVVFIHFLQKFQAAPAVTVFFHIRPLSCPTVAPEDRFSVSRCFPLAGPGMALQHMYRITVRHGYRDDILGSDLGPTIYDNLRKFIMREGVETSGLHLDESSDGSASSSLSPTTYTAAALTPEDPRVQQAVIRESLAHLEQAYHDLVVNIVGKEQMRIADPKSPAAWPRKIALAMFLWLRSNTGSKVANMNLDIEKLVEIGFVKVI